MYFLDLELDWIYVVYFLSAMVLIFFFNRFLLTVRSKTSQKLDQLLLQERNYLLYQELLNNKRLRLVFSKSQISLLRLKGYMLEGNDKKILETIQVLDKSRLRAYVKVDYLLKRFTYFIDVLNKEESKNSLDMLEDMTSKVKDNQELDNFLKEAKFTYQIYIDRDTSLIPKIKKMIIDSKNEKVIGVLYYRLAKLYYFNGQNKEVDQALKNAETLLKGTYYMDIINLAKENKKALEYK
jgi:hydrogenase maturation factor